MIKGSIDALMRMQEAELKDARYERGALRWSLSALGTSAATEAEAPYATSSTKPEAARQPSAPQASSTRRFNAYIWSARCKPRDLGFPRRRLRHLAGDIRA